MYKEKTENVEVYFICYKKEKMNLVESYYDEILNIHCWYFNAYLAYKYWKKGFRKLEIGYLGKLLLTVAASKYLLYKIDNKDYKNEKDLNKILKELKIIEPILQEIIKENDILLKL